MKIMYTRQSDGGVSIVIPAAKADIELILGEMTLDEYKNFIVTKSIPLDATKIKFITDDDIPSTREFRDAWVDFTDDNKINIDCSRAKEVKLRELRIKRNIKLAETDVELVKALESGDSNKLNALKIKRQKLRDTTEPLKALEVSGVDDEVKLAKIKQLALLEV